MFKAADDIRCVALVSEMVPCAGFMFVVSTESRAEMLNIPGCICLLLNMFVMLKSFKTASS